MLYSNWDLLISRQARFLSVTRCSWDVTPLWFDRSRANNLHLRLSQWFSVSMEGFVIFSHAGFTVLLFLEKTVMCFFFLTQLWGFFHAHTSLTVCLNKFVHVKQPIVCFFLQGVLPPTVFSQIAVLCNQSNNTTVYFSPRYTVSSYDILVSGMLWPGLSGAVQKRKELESEWGREDKEERVISWTSCSNQKQDL